ncbi:BLUF domain-containing protein [Simplicispira suum]|uniref:Blue light sensor protein n=1 Tax=Simplicispira suum TaxID=2109915 RepID=A0A2S0N0N5_9BURK|nr:BLUF domain-containing protein [Simplicispira suum]AVO41686.1 blue light sensor protein [Simplicispira suum]MBW7834898.1 BLUF domain-containing protein [Simplicispira suum]
MSQSLLYQVLYVSTLSPEQPLSIVADIAHRARASNAERGITALLAFDGQRFCQMLEGERKPVLSLTERIRNDARHTGVEVLYHGPLQARRFGDFQLAFTSGEEETSFEQLEALDGSAALAAFERLRLALPG